MPRDRQPAGTCPKCTKGAVTCSHNHHIEGETTIDSWEHRCADCGHRTTEAIHSGGAAGTPDRDPGVCPFCGRKAP